MKKFVVSIEEKYFRHFEVEAENEDDAFEKVCAGEVEEVPDAFPHEVNFIDVFEHEELSPETLEKIGEIAELSKDHPEDFFRKGYDSATGVGDYFLFDQRSSDE